MALESLITLLCVSMDFFDSVMIENNIPMTEFSPVQLSALFMDHDETFKRFTEGIKNDTI